LKSLLIKPFANYFQKQTLKVARNAVADQQAIFKTLIKKAANTQFGIDHNFNSIQTHKNFCHHVPIKDYEGQHEYFDRVKNGQSDILWPGKPRYLAKTSGTTSGVKYIPISDDSIGNHINTARNALFNFTSSRKDTSIFDGKLIFLSGSPILTNVGGIKTGRLSGIVNHEIPAFVKGNQLPSYKTNCVEEWEEKLEKVIEETHNQDLRLISGIPPWVQMYFERLLDRTGKETIKDVFPNLSLFVYGGVNYAPYRNTIENLIGDSIHSLETYPASEGFIAFQDTVNNQGLLLNTNSGIFFEFVPANEIFDENPTRLLLPDVELDKDYAIIINNNAGLWGYNIGDTIRFVSKDPYRLIVSGRIKHFISAFGEHVIAKEVEEAMTIVSKKYELQINEFTVAPQVKAADGTLPHHEWFIEFETLPDNLTEVAKALDEEMIRQNIYYQDLIVGNILQPLKIKSLSKGSFNRYMESQGKLGGQNKLPRLSNDRKMADQLF